MSETDAMPREQDECYYCGLPATSDEHAPPDFMFRGFPCGNIQVRSCAEHNTEKSSRDQAIVSALLLPLQNLLDAGEIKLCDLEPNVQTALGYIKSSYKRVKRLAHSSPLVPGYANPAYIEPKANIRGWMRMLTAALVRDGTKSFDSLIDWDAARADSPELVGADNQLSRPHKEAVDMINAIRARLAGLETFNWHDGWSPYPADIYSFQLHFGEGAMIVKHKFYNRYIWYVEFTPSQDTISRLRHKTKV